MTRERLSFDLQMNTDLEEVELAFAKIWGR